MKNLFEKKHNNTGLIVLGITGAAAAGALAYLYLTESGSNTRGRISETVSKEVDKLAKSFKETFNDLTAKVVSENTSISKNAAKTVADHVN